MVKEKKPKILILGAGITGLVSAYYLSKDFEVTLLEKENFIGGTARSFKYKDFLLDYGPHKIYTELPGIIAEIEKVVPLLKIKKRNSIYLKGNYFDFPLKISQIATKMPFTAFNALLDIIKNLLSKKLVDDSYENFLLNRFGKTLYELSFKNYAVKVWNSSPKELDAELAKRRVAISGIFQLIKGILLKDTKNISAEFFYYPKYGIGELTEALVKKIKENNGKIILNSEIKKINLKNNQIESIKLAKSTLKADYFISTIPLDSLFRLLDPSPLIQNPAFSYQDLNVFYFLLKKPKALKDCWIFFPEKELVFQRVSEQKAFSKFTSPEKETAIMVETTKPINEALKQKIILQLNQAGILKKEEISEYFTKTLKKAYPLYKKGFSSSLKSFDNFLDSLENFYTLGRQGLFNYNNMDQCWDMGMKVANQIIQKKSKADWKKTKKYFDKYKIVD